MNKKRLFTALSAINIFFFSLIAIRILTAIYKLPIPFDTDEADHANAALELFRAVQFKELGGIIEAIRRQAFYPPLHSIFVLPFYSLLGVNIFSSRFPSFIAFLLSGVCLFAATFKSTKDSPLPMRLFVSTFSLLLLALNPIVITYSSLSMIELEAVLLTTIILLGATLDEDKNQSPKASVMVLLFASLLIKYNFGILIIPGVIGAYILMRRVKVAATYAVFCALVFFAWICISYKESIFHFFTGHPSYAPLLSFDNLTFEVRSWFTHYSSSIFVGLLTLCLSSYCAIKKFGQAAPTIALSITLVSFGVLLLSTTNEERHFIVAAPCIWYLASLGLNDLIRKFHERAVVFLVVVSLVVYTSSYFLSKKAFALIQSGMEGKIAYGKLEDTIFEKIDPTKPTLVIGATDQFGLEALRFQAARLGNIPYTQTKIDAFPFRDDKNHTAKMRMRNVAAPYLTPEIPKEPLDAVLNTHYYQAMILLRPIGQRSDVSELIRHLKERYEGSIIYQEIADGFEVTVIGELSESIY